MVSPTTALTEKEKDGDLTEGDAEPEVLWLKHTKSGLKTRRGGQTEANRPAVQSF